MTSTMRGRGREGTFKKSNARSIREKGKKENGREKEGRNNDF